MGCLKAFGFKKVFIDKLRVLYCDVKSLLKVMVTYVPPLEFLEVLDRGVLCLVCYIVWRLNLC